MIFNFQDDRYIGSKMGKMYVSAASRAFVALHNNIMDKILHQQENALGCFYYELLLFWPESTSLVSQIFQQRHFH